MYRPNRNACMTVGLRWLRAAVKSHSAKEEEGRTVDGITGREGIGRDGEEGEERRRMN